MPFSEIIKKEIAEFHLLKHPFYQDWSEGHLSIEVLRDYAKQYFYHVKAFPTYISGAHSLCDDLAKRRLLLENLADEEGLNGTNHPELWARFSDGLGVDRNDLNATNPRKAIKEVVNTFKNNSNSSYEEGLASLYAYEYQVPEIAETKIKGLKSFYGLIDDRSLSFFETHKEADIYHRKACELLLDDIPKNKQPAALVAAKASAKSLWNFLSSLDSNYAAA